MFLLLLIMLSGVLGQQNPLSQLLASQQLQNALVSTSNFQTSPQNHLRNFHRNSSSSIHRPPQQQIQPLQSFTHNNVQRTLRHENKMRHQNLPVAPTVYHQNAVNKTRGSSNVFKHMSLSNSSVIWNIQQRDTPTSRHSLSPRQLLLSHGLPSGPVHHFVPQNSPQQFVPEFAPGTSPQHFLPQRLPQISTSERTVLEPVIAFHTTLQPVDGFLDRQNQIPIAKENIDEILFNANVAFLECCKQQNVDTACESRCNFDILDRRVLMAMFVGTDPCPKSNGQKLLSCAAQDSDHTNCCRANGVQQTAAGDKCLGFCQMTPGSKFQADISMLPCWSVLNEIKQCFRRGLTEKQNVMKAA